MTYTLQEEVEDLRMQCAKDTDEIERLQAQVEALTEEKRQLIVGFKAMNVALAERRLCSGGA